jgi:biopolymer transport protein ExbD
MKRRLHEENEVGELNIVPYLDIITNLVMFMLLSMTGLIGLGVLDVSAPKIGGENAVTQQVDPNAPKLLLTVAISRKGFYVAGSGGVLGGPADAPAVDATQPPTLPLNKDGTYDYAGLTEMMKKVKAKYPSEENLIISADADVVYDILIQTMDACRGQAIQLPDGKSKYSLFSLVSLSLIG